MNNRKSDFNSACLALEDGSAYFGKALGLVDNKSFGELVFNTGLTGYQEILTDPSYARQIVTLTYPEIGNYGITAQDNQSRKVFAQGLVIRNISPVVSSWRSNPLTELDCFLKEQGLSGIYGVDTRAITLKLRDQGAMRAVLHTYTESNAPSQEQEAAFLAELIEEVRHSPQMLGRNLIREVSTTEAYELPHQGSEKAFGRIAILDFGIKQNMIELLRNRGFDLKVFPAQSSFEQIRDYKPAGIFLSNGPGDPASSPAEIQLIQQIIQANLVPIFGVCLGHQLLAHALGAKTFKLKFGHRGSNHPVIDLRTRKVFITSQNHGFAVDRDSLAQEELELTHQSLNDGTVEGFRHTKKPIFSVQFHPEASPGPQESAYLFEEFINSIREENLRKLAHNR